MKPLTAESFVGASESAGRPLFLCKVQRGFAVTTDLRQAALFSELPEAQAAQRTFIDRHRFAADGVRDWRALRAVSRTTFKDA